jgi:hypothetical protein
MATLAGAEMMRIAISTSELVENAHLAEDDRRSAMMPASPLLTSVNQPAQSAPLRERNRQVPFPKPALPR